MPRPIPYTPVEEPPHMPLDELQRRLAPYIGEPDAQGCRMWTGSKRRHEGCLRIKAPFGSVTLSAHKLVWASAGNGWLEAPGYLRRTCRRQFCCTLEHMFAVTSQERRGLTDEEVIEARTHYWGQGRRLLGKLSRRPIANPEQHVAWELGLARDTILRVLEGRRVMEHLWPRNVTPDKVREVWVEKLLLVERLKRERSQQMTVEALARKYRVGLTTMSRALRGQTYQHLPMPKERAFGESRGEGRRPHAYDRQR